MLEMHGTRWQVFEWILLRLMRLIFICCDTWANVLSGPRMDSSSISTQELKFDARVFRSSGFKSASRASIVTVSVCVAERYLEKKNFFWPTIDAMFVSDIYFQWDDAICHTSLQGGWLFSLSSSFFLIIKNCLSFTTSNYAAYLAHGAHFVTFA